MTALQNALGWQGLVLTFFGVAACCIGGTLLAEPHLRRWGGPLLAFGVLLLAAGGASLIASAWAGVP